MINEKNKQLEALKNAAKNEWVRPPLYEIRNVVTNRCKMNKDIQTNCLVAKVQAPNCKDSSLYYYLTIKGLESETEKVFPVQTPKSTFEWRFEAPIFNTLWKYEIIAYFCQKM